MPHSGHVSEGQALTKSFSTTHTKCMRCRPTRIVRKHDKSTDTRIVSTDVDELGKSDV